MKKSLVFTFSLPFILGAAGLAQEATGLEGGSPELLPGGKQEIPPLKANAESPAEITARAAWWHEARFGMFIHFGLYSALSGEWKGKPITGHGEWIQQMAPIPYAEYAATAATFNPVQFNAKEWVAMAKGAGMRYMVVTAKHHDGFAMFDSAISDFNIVKATPFKRDVVKELAEACREAGLRFGVYYSNDLDWHADMWTRAEQHAGLDPAKFDAYYRGKAMGQVKELLTNYGPLASVWFDGKPRAASVDQALAFRAMIRGMQPTALINNRLRAVDGDFFNYEQRLPELVDPRNWEGCMTTNASWGYKKEDTRWKPTKTLLFKLVDAVSKGGNMLLNVGPTGEGVIPAEPARSLSEIGAWLAVNGEAIYGVKATPFGPELGAFSATEKNDKGKPVFVAQNAWRCTAKPGKLFITVFTAPKGDLFLPQPVSPVAKAYLLGDAARTPVAVRQTEKGIALTLPSQALEALVPVICLELAGPAGK